MSTQFEEHAADLWNEELRRSREILKNFLETLSEKDREELTALLRAIRRSDSASL